MTVVFAPPAMVTVPTSDGRAFPVHRIYCVGRNYAEHAVEMGATGREAPFFFMKPADAALPVPEGQVGVMAYPPQTQNLHHEVELVVALGQGGRHLTADRAADLIWGYAVGLDMTRRDLQNEMKKQGRPWCIGKAFDQSAPLGPVHPKSSTGELLRGGISLEVNGQRRQSGDISDMIWSVAETISALSRAWELRAGDLIFTGTPAGVGAVQPGDLLDARIAGLGRLQLTIAPSAT